jgi:hypothetical protein
MKNIDKKRLYGVSIIAQNKEVGEHYTGRK